MGAAPPVSGAHAAPKGAPAPAGVPSPRAAALDADEPGRPRTSSLTADAPASARPAAAAPNAPNAPFMPPADPAATPAPALAAPPVLPPALPPEASALLAHAAEDPSLRVSLGASSVRLALENDSGEDLKVRLRVGKDSADLEVSGALAPLVEARLPEVQAALAGAGLALGQFTHDHGQGHAPAPSPADRDEGARPAAAHRAAPPTSAASPTATGPGRIHVTA